VSQNYLKHKETTSKKLSEMESSQKRYTSIIKAINNNYYKDLGTVEFIEEDNIEVLNINVIPNEGIHQKISYKLTIKFQTNNEWPLLYIDSSKYNPMKTSQYKNNLGKNGSHKGICIRNLGYGYAFTKNFKNLCNNDWTNYLYYVIVFFNNPQDIIHANGFNLKILISNLLQVTSNSVSSL
jgi:hypothetical protein